jgi:hypothetical protein
MNAIKTLTKEEEYFSMASIVDMCCNDLDISVAHYFQKFLNWGLYGLVQLKMDTANCVKPLVLPVSDVLTCTLPADAIDITFVGVLYGQYVKELGREDSLSKLDRTVANFNPSKRYPPGYLPNGIGSEAYTPFANYSGRALFSVGGGLPHRGHYTIVERGGCKELLLDHVHHDCNEIYIEYIGLGISNCNEDTIVGPYLSEYVRQYIHHQYAKFGKGANKTEAEIVRTGRELWHAEMVVRGRVNQISPIDLKIINRRNYRLTNKI